MNESLKIRFRSENSIIRKWRTEGRWVGGWGGVKVRGQRCHVTDWVIESARATHKSHRFATEAPPLFIFHISYSGLLFIATFSSFLFVFLFLLVVGNGNATWLDRSRHLSYQFTNILHSYLLSWLDFRTNLITLSLNKQKEPAKNQPELAELAPASGQLPEVSLYNGSIDVCSVDYEFANQLKSVNNRDLAAVEVDVAACCKRQRCLNVNAAVEVGSRVALADTWQTIERRFRCNWIAIDSTS